VLMMLGGFVAACDRRFRVKRTAAETAVATTPAPNTRVAGEARA